MDMIKKFLCLLAIFCVIGTVGTVCAADSSSMGHFYTSQDNGALQQHNMINTTNSTNMTINETALFADQCKPYHADGSSPFAAAGEPTNTTSHANKTVAHTNTTSHANKTVAHTNANSHANNTTASHPAKTAGATSNHNLPSTGNPILILLITFCGAGSVLVLRRRK